ncbi:MAG: hypothetical protein QOE90_1800 [Thermoplasmata archaeon]|jgi:drug/metabolite transporter (DMT)-like permease|nr:hypothetical protein [Thermoplasmata archaeon]
MRPRTWGVLAALAAAATFAAVNVAGRFALGRGVQPLWMAAFTYLGGGLLMLPHARRAKLAPAERLRMGLVILCGAVAAPLLLFFGLQRTGAADASLVLNLEMGATTVLAIAFLRERLGMAEALGVALLAAGAIVVSAASGARGGSTLVGVLLVAGAALLWAMDNTLSTPLSRTHDPRALIAVKTLGGGVVVLSAALVLAGAPGGDPLAWAVALASGAVGVAVSSVLFYVALARIGAARTTALFATSGLFGVTLAALALREPLTAAHFVAAALCVLGAGALLVRTDRTDMTIG